MKPPLQFLAESLDAIREDLRSANTKFGIKRLDAFVDTLREMAECPMCLHIQSYSEHARGHPNEVLCRSHRFDLPTARHCSGMGLATRIGFFDAREGVPFCRKCWTLQYEYLFNMILELGDDGVWRCVKNKDGLIGELPP